MNTVVNVCYKTQGQVWINATQYFDDVPQEAGTSQLAVIRSVRNG